MRSALGRRRRAAAAGALAAAAIAVLVVASGAVSGGGGGPSRAATSSTATTEISRRNLVEEESADGTLGHGDSRAVVNRLSGTVTWLPQEGAVVKPDGRLYEVDGSPVIVMDGSVPAYRALGESVSNGPDVAELERNLRELGYDPGGAIALDDSWDAGTTAAVIRWQQAHGLDETGSIELGRVIFQPGRRRVESIDVTLGGDTGWAGGGGSGSGSSDSSSGGASTKSSTGGDTAQAAATNPETAQTRLASFSAAGAGARTAQANTTPDQGADEESDRERELARRERELKRREAALRRREQRLKREQRRQQQAAGGGSGGGGSGGSSSTGGGSSASETGGAAAAGGSASGGVASQVMTTTSTRPVVSVDLDTSKESLARVGALVSVELPSGSTVRGRIASVGKVATSDSSADTQAGDQAGAATQDATVKVTIRLAKRTGALDEAPATVNFERSRRKHVLAVPVTALLARAGGTFAVEVRDGGGRRIVPVTAGLYTSGFVEIDGDGLEAGMKVTDARV